jgi:drug/metabolite transporter (DMT)-like permease
MKHPLALLHLTVFIWGFTAILGKLLSLEAMALVWYRQGLASLVLFGVWAWVRPAAPTTRQRLALWGTGLLVCLHWVAFYAAIKTAGVAVAVVCLSTCSFFVSLVEPFVFRRAMRWGEAALGLLVVGGVLLLTGSTQTTGPWGIALGISSALFSALFGTLNGKLAQSLSPLVISVHELSAATLWLSLGFLFAPQAFVHPLAVSATDWGWLSILVLACTVFPWLWSLKVLRAVAPFTMALAINLEPVYSIAIAYAVFPTSERLTPGFYLGTLTLISAVVAHGLWRARRTEQTM